MPIFIPLICLVAMGLALFRRSIRFPRPARRCARTWFSLDQGDNDLALFWTYLAAALNTAASRGDTGAPWLLQPPSRRARRAFRPA
jgi:hypothetical protein